MTLYRIARGLAALSVAVGLITAAAAAPAVAQTSTPAQSSPRTLAVPPAPFAPLAQTTSRTPTTLRAVMQADLNMLDPIWTTASIVLEYGYLVYDTLFAMDEQGRIQPQMVERYTVSADKLSWTFTLRDGLLFHDGAPVTADDCVASIRRWGAKDVVGQALMGFVTDMKVVDAKTFTIAVKEPVGLMLQGLGKPSSSPAFIMPKRVALTPADQQISEAIGSGPYVFQADAWQPGVKAVFVKFDRYRPRAEPPSMMAGGKVAKIDRIEWIVMNDQQTAINALKAGEIDFIEQPAIDLLPQLTGQAGVQLFDADPLGNQFVFRFNTLHKPFDDPKVRAVLWYAFNQEDFLKATVGDPKYYKPCKALFICGTPLASEAGMSDKLGSNLKKARELLKASGYDGTPVVLLQSTDLAVLTNLAPVAKSLMEKVGFKVEMVSMDWKSLVARRARKEPPDKGGWNALLTAWGAAAVMDPVSAALVNAACDKAPYGWPCDAKIEALRSQFIREPDLAKQKAIAEQIQLRQLEFPTVIPLGQYYQPYAMRSGVTGMLRSPVPIFWNAENKRP